MMTLGTVVQPSLTIAEGDGLDNDAFGLTARETGSPQTSADNVTTCRSEVRQRG